MVVFDDLVAEQDRLDAILGRLDEREWASPSAARGWTIADVVLHLAQTEEAVAASVAGADLALPSAGGATLDEVMDRLVRAEQAAPAAVFPRRRAAARDLLCTHRSRWDHQLAVRPAHRHLDNHRRGRGVLPRSHAAAHAGPIRADRNWPPRRHRPQRPAHLRGLTLPLTLPL